MEETRSQSDSATPLKAAKDLGKEPPPIYFFCDRLSAYVIYAMVIFSPWAFGTTQEWAMWVMNCAGYALGLLLFIKLGIRRMSHCLADRWDEDAGAEGRFLTRILAVS